MNNERHPEDDGGPNGVPPRSGGCCCHRIDSCLQGRHPRSTAGDDALRSVSGGAEEMKDEQTTPRASLSRRKLLQGTAAAAGAAALGGSLAPQRAAASVRRAVRSQAAGADTLVIGMEAEISSFDPAVMTGTSTFRPVSSMFDMLVNLFDTTTDIKPDLAEKWDVAEDGMSVTAHLRPGVKFQHGTDLNADAVVFSFERMLNPNSPDYHGPYTFPSFFYPSYKTSTAVDPVTVRFDLNEPDATF